MYLKHQSRISRFRHPYGAVPTGTEVRFAVQLKTEGETVLGVYLAYAHGLYAFETSRCRLMPDDARTAAGSDYAVSLRMPLEPCLYFYWFEIETGQGKIYLTRDREDLQGGGQLAKTKPRWLPGEAHSPLAWQVTVYDQAYTVPAWLTGAVIYQIFPDRFRRDAAFSPERFEAVANAERIFHEDWDEDVDIVGKPETGYIACDFFGGSLNGIREKLDYLAALGVTVLYLNPIFKARSNHRYDTGDYGQVDPLLGTTEDFIALCAEAQERGIRVLLDGVFSHTGADSRYFNKLGRYPGSGAWQEATEGTPSPYASWYVFHRQGDQLFYDAWWGFPDLPSVNEHDLTFRDTITGKNGVIRHWMRLGAAGWRLDVSDELPDAFLRELRLATRAEKEDAVLLGEVWEDASNKISYGSYRDFLLGRTHDHVMGYPFQQALIGWLAGHFPAQHLHLQLETLREHYPPPAWSASFNLISSHDIMRAMTALAGPPDPGSREAQAQLVLTADQRQAGETRLRLAVFFQMIYPGCPVVYYGDETAMEGYRDPFNRRTFPWGRENKPLQQWFSWLGCLRRDWTVLRIGSVRVLYAEDDCLVLERFLVGEAEPQPDTGPHHVLAVLNRAAEEKTVQLENRTIRLAAGGCLLEADGKKQRPPDSLETSSVLC